MAKKRTRRKDRKPAYRGPAFKNEFYIALDGQFYTEMHERRITPAMLCVYTMILRQVDFETGVWHGSAYRICDGWGWQIKHRTAQDSMKKLCDAGYLKSFHISGSRNDYAVLVHGYKVRFGKWRGHKLDAEATKDWRIPVFVRNNDELLQTNDAHDPSFVHQNDDFAQNHVEQTKGDKPFSAQRPRNVTAASPQAPRNIRASSAQHPRIVSAASAYPNARNTPDIPDYPDFPVSPHGQEEPDGKDTTNSKALTSFAPRGENVVDVAAPASESLQELSSTRNKDIPNRDICGEDIRGKDSKDTRQQWEKPELLAAFREIYERQTHKHFNATKAHIDAITDLVAPSRSSFDLVLAAFEEWCRSRPDEMFTAGVDGKAQDIAWPLQKFVGQGYAKEYIDQVRPYAHLLAYRGETLQAILDADDPTVTEGQAKALHGLIQAHGCDLVYHARVEAGSVQNFVQAPTQFLQRAYLRTIAYKLGTLSSSLTTEIKAAALEFAEAVGGWERALEIIGEFGPSQADFVAFCRDQRIRSAAAQVA